MADDYLGPRSDTRTGGRAATTAVLAGDFALSIGKPVRASPPGWAWTPLSSLADLQTGHTPSRKREDYWGGDIPWVGIKDATQNNGKTIYKTVEFTNPVGIANSSARILPAQTVCLSRTASVGYVVIMGLPMATSQDFVNWVCGDSLNPLFLKYVLLAENRALHMYASGTTHQTIYFPEAKAFHICAPQRSEQDAIVEVLDALDAKIEHNQRLSATLEESARALFQSWFIDFDPVHAKAEARDPALPAEIAALFPNRFGDNGLPEGWNHGTIQTIADVNSENWNNRNHPNKVEYVDLANTKFGVIESTTIMDWDDAPSRARRVAKTGDSIIGTVRPGNGSYAYISNDGLTVSTGFAVLRPKATFYRDAVYIAATTSQNIERMTVLAAGHGGAYPAINPEVVGQTSFPEVPNPVMIAFSESVAGIRRKIEHAKYENAKLAETRDQLLPKLISGELRIPVIANRVAAA